MTEPPRPPATPPAPLSNAGQPRGEPPDNDPDETRGFASPACLACELDPHYFDPPEPLPVPELIEFLNRLLEAEWAGAKTLAVFRKSAGLAAAQAELAALERDEVRYAAMLSEAIRDLGGIPSLETGGFFARATAIEGAAERLRFLNRGQGWVVRQLTETLPRIKDGDLRARLAEMHRTHIENIQRCDALIGTLAPEHRAGS